MLPAIASAQTADPFTPPGGLHPHQQHCQQREILGDAQLPQHSQDDQGMGSCGSPLA
ncbi:hypothetical protein [Pantoea sp.]|uniref:hypothetical protein n=1 Tax=Pantoea sp. TaxID=69393 RepID=UPI00289671E2|nr:hypothetical protein [Pantoea sp.]